MDDIIKSFINNQDLSDVSFLVGKGEKLIYGHRFFFALNSDAFKKMFYGSLIETKMPIRIPDVTINGFNNMIKYLYTMKLDFELDQLAETYLVMDKYLINNLNGLIKKYINLKLGKSNDLILILNQLIEIDRITSESIFPDKFKFKICTNRSLFNNLKDIYESTLIYLLNCKFLSIKEIDLLKFCAKWVKNEALNRKLELTIDNYLTISKSIKHYFLFSELNIIELHNFNELTYLLTKEEIGELYLYLNTSNRQKFPIECKTKRKPLFSKIFNDEKYEKRNSYLRSSIKLTVNDKILLVSIDLKIKLNNLKFDIYENDTKLKLDYSLDSTNINFNSKLILKSNHDYKLAFQFDRTCFYGHYLENLSTSLAIFKYNKQHISLRCTNLDGCNFMHCINFFPIN